MHSLTFYLADISSNSVTCGTPPLNNGMGIEWYITCTNALDEYSTLPKNDKGKLQLRADLPQAFSLEQCICLRSE
jgi:hypothetical protein